MSLTIPLSEPPALTAGETALWQRQLSPDFPAGDWTLNYHFIGPTRINITSTANGTAHEVNISAATTANYTAGTYQVIARVSDGTSVFPVAVATPILEVFIDPATADVPPLTDPRTWAAQTLEQVETALKSLAGKTVSQTTINGTTYTLHDLDKLRKFRGELLSEVRAEEEAAALATGKPSKRMIQVQFTRPY